MLKTLQRGYNKNNNRQNFLLKCGITASFVFNQCINTKNKPQIRTPAMNTNISAVLDLNTINKCKAYLGIFKLPVFTII